MSLDVFNPLASDQNVMANAARDLPADFSESFDVSTRAMTEWNSSLNFENARDRALATFYDGVKARTGVQLPLYGMGGNVSLDELNAAIAKLPQQAGDVEPSFAPLSEGSIRGMALERMRKAHGDAEAFAHRETSWSGTAGTVLGTLAAGVSDPVTLATLPLGGAGQLGIAGRALEFAAIAGGTEAVIAGAGGPARVAAVPGSAKEIPGEIATATLFGGALGGMFGAFSKMLGHGAKPLPTTVRDELNAASSEAQLNLTNPFPTAAGEAAARDAAIEATTRAVKGEPVTVADGFDARHVADYALAAKSQTPEELAIAGEKHLRPETYGLAPDVERFDRMPAEADDVASYWDKRLEAASPQERAALGATDASPLQEEIVRQQAFKERMAMYGDDVSARDLTPEQLKHLAADPATDAASLHNLEHIIAEKPDLEFSTQIRQPDGSYQLVTQKLSDVLGEIDGLEAAGKELEACAAGLAQAAE